MLNSNLGLGTNLTIRKSTNKAPLSWKLANIFGTKFLVGLFNVKLAKLFSKVTSIPTLTSELSLKAKINGKWIDYGTVCYRVVTDAGVAYIVDDWDGGANVIDNFNYHGCGTGTTAEAAGDTALVTESTTALNPDSTRATGTKTQPAANQMRSTGTVTFDASAAITEHGIFSQAATGGGTLLDRSVFSAINVTAADQITFQWSLTLNSGS